ncbi:DUF6325 family protein [Actinoplanes sp. TBRC 11911]|uniref:DUF6325 family protein n=1 Tax=Actinoplanes sp. TBRC 11911 TaxID=2729386 RepID=UPI001B7D4EEF|nr:DUF6325 family protein [Actinoplanes sp. TBRC 11911]
MTDDLQQMGPVDYLCVEFPPGGLNGEALPRLVDLVDRGIIRVLDMMFVRRGRDGSIVVIDRHELEESGLGVFHGASSGILGGDDLEEAKAVLTPGATAVIMVYENLWAAPLATALRRAGAQLVAGGRIHVQAILAALDATEAETAPVTAGKG